MRTLHLLVSAAMSAVLLVAAAKADAQQRAVGGGLRITPPPPTFHPRFADGALRSAPPNHHGGGMHGFHGGFHGVWIVEREVVRVVEREVVRDDKPAERPVAAAPPAPTRKPYVIGHHYASLPPQGCMKLIEDGASYYYCSGEWYRQAGKLYRAVVRKL